MAGTSTLTVTGTLASGTTGSEAMATNSIVNTSAVEYVQLIALANGANTITVPTTGTPKGFYLIMAPGNTSVITLKGVTGDTGFAIAKTGIVVMSFDTSPPANFVITVTTSTTSCWIIWI